MKSPENNSKISGFRLIFRALRYRNYRLFFYGQTTSLVGTWMQQTALSWLVYRMTNSPFLLGIVGFSGQIPSFIFSPLAGVIADRYNRRSMLIFTQILAMAQALILTGLVFTKTITVWHIIALSIFLGLVNSFDMPLRQAFTIETIENSQDLGNAIALNSSMVNLARLLGPSIAGILIALSGEGVCFFLNALSYLAVIVSLSVMRLAARKVSQQGKHIFDELKEGFRYAFGFMPIKSILILLGLISLTGVPYMLLMPVFARDIFQGGPKTLGFLMAISGLGALTGALYLAGRRNVLGLGKIIVWASGLFGLGIIAFSLSKLLWLSMFCVLIAGFGMMVQMAASNTILQSVVEEDMRGRVMSFFTVAFMGIAPFGSLLAGGLAHNIGAPRTVFIGGACCILGAIAFALKLPELNREIRPVYASKGIIPEENK